MTLLLQFYAQVGVYSSTLMNYEELILDDKEQVTFES